MRDMFRQPSRISNLDKLGPGKCRTRARETVFIGLGLFACYRWLPPAQAAGRATGALQASISSGSHGPSWWAAMKESFP